VGPPEIINMQAVILAAGRGVRMGKLTNDLPKPLLKISGRPIIEYTLHNLPSKIDEVILIVGYKGEKIKKHLGNEWQGKKISYIDQPELNGTGGALWSVRDLLKYHFMVLMGDDLYHQEDLEKLLSSDLALLVKQIDDNNRFGVVEVDDEGYLKSVIEFRDLKDRQIDIHLVNMGAYMLTKEIFNYPLAPISEKEFGLPQTLARMADKHKIKVVKAGVWHPNGHQGDLIKGEEVVIRHFNHLTKNK